MAAPPRFMNNIYTNHPDNDSKTIKQVFLQAAGQTYPGYGDRHVLIWWSNDTTTDHQPNSMNVIQIIQLTGQSGNYAYYYPFATIQALNSITENKQFLLGEFTHEQRQQILDIAKKIKFEKTSVVNGCRVWTRDLLGEMVGVGLISKDTFTHIDTSVPLVLRKPEV